MNKNSEILIWYADDCYKLMAIMDVVMSDLFVNLFGVMNRLSLSLVNFPVGMICAMIDLQSYHTKWLYRK